MADQLTPASTTFPPNTTEHYQKCVLAGTPAEVRERLVNALEHLGYDIVDDDAAVIVGRRGPRGWASSYASADVLDYPRNLIIRLKQLGPHATRATFDYAVKHPSLSRGEVDILTRESEVLAAMATIRATEKMCPACGTEATDDSRFCRQCGSALTVRGRELELFLMAAEVRAGYTSAVATTLVSAGSALLIGTTLAAMLLSGIPFGPGFVTLLIVGLAASFFSIIFSAFGWNRFSRALKVGRDRADHPVLQGEPEQVGGVRTPPTFEIPMSVTEGTTNLLDPLGSGAGADSAESRRAKITLNE